MKHISIASGDNPKFRESFKLPVTRWGKNKSALAVLAVAALTMLGVPLQAQDLTLTPTSEFKVFAGGGGYQGAYNNIEFKASISGDFTGNPVTLLVSGAPAGVTYSFTTTSFTTTQNKDTLKLAVTNVAKGTYPLTISAKTNGVPVGNSFTMPLIVGTLWTNTTGGDWNVSANWSAGVPTTTDNVMFQNFGNATTNFLSTSYSVRSLTFLPSIANVVQNVLLAPGSTLSVLGTNGFAMNVDYPTGNSQRTTANFEGTSGAIFLVSNSVANVAINGVNTSTGTTLDMRNLDIFNSYVAQFGVGDNELALQGERGIQAVKVYFAKTNLVNANHLGNFSLANHDYLDFAVSFVNNTHDFNNGSSFDAGLLGLQNTLQADSFGFGQGRAGGSSTRLKFNSTSFDSSASFRNADGTSRVSLVAAAVDSYGPGGTGSNTRFQLDFRGGNVDMLVNEMWLGRNNFYTNTSSAQQDGRLYFNQGIVDVNTLRVGYQAFTNDSFPKGTVEVGGDAGHSALLVVNTDLNLGYTSGDNSTGANAAQTYGHVTVKTNGTVRAKQVTVGDVSLDNFITIESGGTLEVSNTVASSAKALRTLTVNNGGAVTLHVNGANTLVYVTNLVASSGVINIGSVSGSIPPSGIPVISYAPGAGETASFVAGNVPGGYSAVVFNNTSEKTIKVALITGTPKTLVWRGYADNKWDNSTKNWLDTATLLHTNFATGDSVIFDDLASFNSIDVIEDVVPRQSIGVDGMTMTNNSLDYTFNGSGGIRGAASFVKAGAKSVTVNNYTEVAAQVIGGLLTGSGTLGTVTVSPGTTCSLLTGGTVLGSATCGGKMVNAGTIQGALTVQTLAVVTNALGGLIQGALSTAEGCFIYNAGTFTAMGSATIATNAIFINAGALGSSGQNAGSLTVAAGGTFKDMGLGATPPTVVSLTTLTINGGGTFIPGGDGIGTTKVLNDGLATYNGRVILLTGSTNIFKVNLSASPSSTILQSGYMSFGPNQNTLQQNGGILKLVQNGGPAYSVGNTLALVQNNFGGTPFNVGLNTTNSLSVIDPSAPASGLAWDLSQLIYGGMISVKTTPTTGTNIVFNSSFTQTISTNVPPITNNYIVLNLSWPADYIGWKLQQQQNDLTVGLSTNWTDIAAAQFTNNVVFSNSIAAGAVFYRMVSP